jgi:hypothetical protein
VLPEDEAVLAPSLTPLPDEAAPALSPALTAGVSTGFLQPMQPMKVSAIRMIMSLPLVVMAGRDK